MKRCAQCLKPFGLVRRGLDWRIGPIRIRLWDNKFCGDTCESLYAAERAEGVRVLGLSHWLYSRPP